MTVLGSAALATVALPQAATNPAVTVSVDASANRHAINPMVYGVNYGTTAQLSELRSPAVRMGGNNQTRYNWQLNADNRARDWYFESIAAESGSATPGEIGDTFIRNAKAAGAQPMVTFPIIGWVAKVGANRGKLASFSIAKYGAQTGADYSWFPDAGNGVRTSGGFVTGNDPNDANVPNSASMEAAWAQHLVQQWGNASGGGLKYYILDNEYSIWQETHRDIQPTGAKMDEIRDLMISYAKALKGVDPGAQIVGPEEWGWSGFKFSGYDQQYGKTYGWGYLPDSAAHNGMWYVPYLLQQIQQASAASGQRLLDVLTVHWYPQSGEYGNDTSTAMQLTRNRSTRSLWDPSYVDPTWINDTVQLVPRLRNWVNQYYPGTKTGITEYSWGADGHINGATTQADIFGIFGREGLDIGTRWVMPDSTTPTYKAMKIYRNYDGKGGAFGETSVKAAVPNPDELAAFAAQRSSDGALTVVVINKVLSGSTPVTLSLGGFTPASSASAWQLTAANAITQLANVSVGSTSLSLTVPAQSITMLVIPQNGSPNPNPTPTPTPNPTPTPTPTPGPTPTPPPPGSIHTTYGNNGQPWAISATAATRIEAENYDQGGEGIAYHDSDSGNNGGSYRTEGVDIQGTSDAGGGNNVGWIIAGEWMEYTVNVAAAGTYDVKLRTARQPTGNSYVRVLFNGANATGDITVPSTGGWQSWSTVAASGVTLKAGTQVMRVAMTGGDFNVNWIEISPTSTTPPGTRSTYGNNGNPWAIGSAKAHIEAENYDQGGEGVAYHDSDAANNGGQYRKDGVDLESASGGGYDVGWVVQGEWLEYTVNVATTGTYDLKMHVARNPTGNGLVKVLFGGVDKTGDVTVPSTAGWQNYTDITKTGISLSAGTQVMRVAMDSSSFNIDWIEITQTPGPNPTPTPTPTPTPGPTPTPTPGPTPTPTPSPTPTPAPPPTGTRSTYGNGGNPWAIGSAKAHIEAENYDQGGEGVTYHDSDAANNGGQYRNDGVDLESASGGGYNVGWVVQGEWLEYTVNVATAGSYDLKLHVARAVTGNASLRVLFGGVDKTGSISVPSTGSWQTWTDVTKTGLSLSAGTQVMRLALDVTQFNVDWIEITPSTTGTTPPAASVAPVYTDALASDWSDWSWSSTLNFGATTWVKNGSKALDVSYQAYGGVSLRKGTALATTGYNYVKFWVFGGSGSTKSFHVLIQTADTGGESPVVTVSAPANTWTQIAVPLSSLGSPSAIKRITIQENNGVVEPTITFDDIQVTP